MVVAAQELVNIAKEKVNFVVAKCCFWLNIFLQECESSRGGLL